MTTNRRYLLHEILEGILGSENVYFQPTSTVRMQYPCIVYKLDAIDQTHADNLLYRSKKRYSVTAIDRDPDSKIPDKLLGLEYSSFDTFFATDDLNHFIYSIYF